MLYGRAGPFPVPCQLFSLIIIIVIVAAAIAGITAIISTIIITPVLLIRDAKAKIVHPINIPLS